jgi:hypothetical protein
MGRARELAEVLIEGQGFDRRQTSAPLPTEKRLMMVVFESYGSLGIGERAREFHSERKKVD